MAKNKLTDFNDHLFAQLERLSDETLSPEQLEKEINRSKAITDLSKPILESARITLQAVKLAAEYGKVPEQFGIEQKNLPIDKTNNK